MSGEGESERVDHALVTRGIARSRAQARAYVDAGRVVRAGRTVRKSSEQVTAAEALALQGEPERWVGRAAYKLIEALAQFGPLGLTVAGRRCLDVGASTGGFTQVLLEHEATEVIALDVGHDQLAAQVRADPRVVERSGTSIRDVGPQDLGTFDLVVGDLSFISLRLVLPRLAPLVRPDGDVVLLVKPQFEVGRAALARTGVVRSRQQRQQSVLSVIEVAAASGLHPRGLAASPVTGATGNHEYLLWLAPGEAGMMSAMQLRTVLDEATP